jgi:hypothetical protein
LPTIQANVIGHGEDGSTILHTPFATLKIYTAQPLPTGTKLDIRAEIVARSGVDSITTFPTAPQAAPEDFDYLAQALSRLQTTDPDVMNALLNQLPSIGPKFTSGLLFFLTAVKGGDVRTLFNPRIQSRLETLSPTTLNRLGLDIDELHTQWTNSPLQDWKAVTLPLVWQQTVNPVRLYVRDDTGGGDKATAEAIGQRFLLDLHLSALGDMQIDGFVRHTQKARSLELYLRAATPLEAGIIDGIRTIFEQSLGATGLTGHLVFQEGIEHFVRPALKPPASTSDGNANTILA